MSRSIHHIKWNVQHDHHALVPVYLEEARDLKAKFFHLQGEGMRTYPTAWNLKAFCSVGFGWDPEMMERIGTTREQVELLLQQESVQQAAYHLDRCRSGANTFQDGWELARFVTRCGISAAEIGTTMEEVNSCWGAREFQRPHYFK